MRRLAISDEGGYRRVIALEPIPKSSLHIDMRSGEEIALHEMDDAYYAFQIDEALFLGTREADESDPTCFLNHACTPNLSFFEGEAVLINHRDIARGEELTWDYSTSIDDGLFDMKCHCQSPECRKTIRSFGTLEPAQRQKLLPYSLRYLQRKYAF